MSAELSRAELERRHALLSARVKARRQNKLADFLPHAKQLEVIRATRDFRAIAARWGNQSGKTLGFSYITSVWATGQYPNGWEGRVFHGPTNGWIIGESTAAVRDVAQRYLVGVEGGEPGFIPPDRIAKVIRSHGAGDAIDQLHVRHASGAVSTIGFKSYDMQREKLQGSTLNWFWADEEPPAETWTELLARLIATDGTALASFTPLAGMNRVIPWFNERTAQAMKSRIIIPGRADDFPHLKDPEKQAQLLAMFPAHERRARLEGIPMLGSGAVFEDVQLEDITEPMRLTMAQRAPVIMHTTYGEMETSGLAWLWAIDFGIGHHFAAVLLAHDRDTDTIYVMAAFKIKGGVPSIHASRMNAIMPSVRVAWPHDGNQRDKGSGEQLATIYKREGLNMLPTHAQFARGGYSTEAGIVEMLVRMRAGRFKVAAPLYEWGEEFLSYHRKEGLIVKQNDDILSATRIGVMQIRSARPLADNPNVVWRNGVYAGRSSERMARGVDDWDIFDPTRRAS
jgi:phage terminase large subunit-like protein